MQVEDYDAEHVYKIDFGLEPFAPHIRTMTAAHYVALAIGPDSQHDMVRVQFPGFDATLSKGTVLPLPSVKGIVSIKLSTKRPFDGRVQVLGCESWDEAHATSTGTTRAPYIQESGHDIPSLATETLIRPYTGRSTATLLLQNALAAAPDITIKTYGRIVRDGFGGGGPEIFDVLLNSTAWNAADRFAWTESEPAFEFIRYDLVNNDIILPNVGVWTRYEARD